MNWFRRKDPVRHAQDEVETDYRDIYDEYIRLVSFGAEDEFLDVDTPLIIDNRDLIEGYVEADRYSEGELVKLNEVDELFRTKTRQSLLSYTKAIQDGDKNSDYLKMVLRGLEYPNSTSKKWWYHLLDDLGKSE